MSVSDMFLSQLLFRKYLSTVLRLSGLGSQVFFRVYK